MDLYRNIVVIRYVVNGKPRYVKFSKDRANYSIVDDPSEATTFQKQIEAKKLLSGMRDGEFANVEDKKYHIQPLRP